MPKTAEHNSHKENSLVEKLIPFGILAIAIASSFAAFSEKQKASLKERDGNSCQFPGEHDCGGKLIIHQIMPPKYADTFGIDPDFAANGITICGNALKIVYPDVEGKTPAGIKQAMKTRAIKLGRRQPYWDDKNDRAMTAMVAKNTQTAEADGWTFPEKRTRTKAIPEDTNK